mgnify:CR=1 FL=1
MGNNIEVIGIDHGWSQMKTYNECFNTSIKELPNAPVFNDNVLEFEGRYYAVEAPVDSLNQTIGAETRQRRVYRRG